LIPGECENKPNLESEFSVSSKSRTIRKTLYHLISDFYIVKKFIWTLRDATIYRPPKRLRDIHLKMINDWSFAKAGWGKNAKEEIDEKKQT
jgi:hypothetical protein